MMPSTTASNELSTNTIRVKLTKQRYGGLGFLVKQRALKPFVLVASIVKGGVAEESGLVQIGDIILRINDIDLTEMSYASAIEVLKAVPLDTAVVLLLRGPEGYTTHLQTTFQENGQPRTVRVSKPVHESIMGRLKKTFTGSSSPMSPVKGLKRLCNGEAEGKGGKGDGEADNDVDSTGGGDYSNMVSIEEAGCAGEATDQLETYGHQRSGVERKTHNGQVPSSGDHVRCEASKFLFKNEGRVESEEETVLDNGAVGSPKIVLTSPKSKGSLPRAQTYDSGVGDSGRGGVSSPCHKRAIEIVQDDDEITVVVRGDVSVRSEDFCDPNTPRTFIISTQRHSHASAGCHSNGHASAHASAGTAPSAVAAAAAPVPPATSNAPGVVANTSSSITSIDEDSFSTHGPMSPKLKNELGGGGRTSPLKSPATSPTRPSNGDDENGRGRTWDRMKRVKLLPSYETIGFEGRVKLLPSYETIGFEGRVKLLPSYETIGFEGRVKLLPSYETIGFEGRTWFVVMTAAVLTTCSDDCGNDYVSTLYNETDEISCLEWGSILGRAVDDMRSANVCGPWLRL
ncbi:hypothetical protein Btru_038805 [Bulinus truncatus]|nr:hypothetical protein Btru_038805 [Bulinus truncatus]